MGVKSVAGALVLVAFAVVAVSAADTASSGAGDLNGYIQWSADALRSFVLVAKQAFNYIPASLHAPIDTAAKGFASCAFFGAGIHTFAAHVIDHLKPSLLDTLVALREFCLFFAVGSVVADVLTYRLLRHTLKTAETDRSVIYGTQEWIHYVVLSALPNGLVDVTGWLCALKNIPFDIFFSALVVGKLVLRPVVTIIALWGANAYDPELIKMIGNFITWVLPSAVPSEGSDLAVASIFWAIVVFSAASAAGAASTGSDEDEM